MQPCIAFQSAKTFKVRDLAYGMKELVQPQHNAHFENTENGRMVFSIKPLGNDMFELSLHADRRFVSGDSNLYVW